MAENRLARALTDLLAQARAMLGPGPEGWVGLGLKLNRHADLAAGIAAVRSAEARLHTVIAGELRATAQRQALDSAAWDFITLGRNVLKPHLGGQWSQRWALLNFPNYSLRIPQCLNQRLAILSGLAGYLAEQPQHECAQLGVTAAQTRTRHDQLLAASLALNHLRSERTAALRARDEAVTKLRRRMRCIIRELSMVIAKADPRWFAFGLNQPATHRKRKTMVGRASPRAEAESKPAKHGRTQPDTSHPEPDTSVTLTADSLPLAPRTPMAAPMLEFKREREFLRPVLAARPAPRRRRSLLAWFLPS